MVSRGVCCLVWFLVVVRVFISVHCTDEIQIDRNKHLVVCMQFQYNVLCFVFALSSTIQHHFRAQEGGLEV